MFNTASDEGRGRTRSRAISVHCTKFPQLFVLSFIRSNAASDLTSFEVLTATMPVQREARCVAFMSCSAEILLRAT
jgi:hypothetical protein